MTSGETLAIYRRVKISGSTVVYADSTDRGIGVTQHAVTTSGDEATIRLDIEGTSKMVADGAITAGADVYAADDGKISSSGTIELGSAIEAASADGDIIEVLPRADVAASVSDLNVFTSDYVWASSDINVNTSDIVVLKSDIAANDSDIVVLTSDIAAAASDITILESDSTAVQSDIVVLKSDIAANDSDIVVIKSDVITNNSNVESAISDALLAHAAGDWANVSDVKVTIAEIIAAFSDALI